MTEFKSSPHFVRKDSTVMYICTYCNYADNDCECDDQIELNEHSFLKITTTTELVVKDIEKE